MQIMFMFLDQVRVSIYVCLCEASRHPSQLHVLPELPVMLGCCGESVQRTLINRYIALYRASYLRSFANSPITQQSLIQRTGWARRAVAARCNSVWSLVDVGLDRGSSLNTVSRALLRYV